MSMMGSITMAAGAAMLASVNAITPSKLMQNALLQESTLSAATAPKKMTAVIKILEDMRDQIDTDQAEDEKSFAKMECWCKKNDMTLSEAQAAAQAELERLRASVTANTAEAAALGTELVAMEKELKQARESVDELITMNTKTVEEDSKTVAEYTESVTALANAITVLSKHQPGLSQQKVVLELRKHVNAHQDVLDALLEPGSKRALDAFLQNGQNPNSPAYSSQSGQIFGILSEMKDQFGADLSALKEKMASDKVTYGKLKKSKEEGIADLEKGITSKTSRKAEAKQEAADAKQQIADIEKTMAADLEFLAEVKKVCPKANEEFAKRTEDRHMETTAIAKAIDILGSDESRDMFDKTVEQGPAMVFFQKSIASAAELEKRNDVGQLLQKLAASDSPMPSTHNAALKLISASVKLAPFTRVVEAIKTMIAEIKEKKSLETGQKDECAEKMNDNEKETAAAENELEKFKGQLEKHEADLATKVDAIEKTKTQISDAEKGLKDLEEDRAEAFKVFQQNVADQSTAIELLGKAISELSMVYENLAKGGSFVQVSQEPEGPSAGLTHSDAPEMGTYKKNQAGTGVVAMLQGIQDEARKTLSELRIDQEEANKDFMKQRDLLTDVKQSSELALSTLNFEKADLDKGISTANGDINDKVAEIASLTEIMKSYREECDFLLKHFDVRQEAMTTEVEALNQAIAILKGSDAGGEMQTIYANPTSFLGQK
ncbi:unnamed protein product [Amoebophrya sp. A25]|nr:unnamed protein product [Amoebophrya sp. A25]|eukprot:GSA25T00020606001.1